MGSASVILPWLIYKWYGDTSVINEAWPMMCGYVDFLKSKTDHHILSHGLGDWFDLGPKSPGPSQLTPLPLTATAIYYYDLVYCQRWPEYLKSRMKWIIMHHGLLMLRRLLTTGFMIRYPGLFYRKSDCNVYAMVCRAGG